jgi:hypothetical protein
LHKLVPINKVLGSIIKLPVECLILVMVKYELVRVDSSGFKDIDVIHHFVQFNAGLFYLLEGDLLHTTFRDVM